MRLKSIIAAWDEFWFKSESPLSMGIIRILFGILLLQFCYLLEPNLLAYFGNHAVVLFFDRDEIGLNIGGIYRKLPS